MDTLAGVLRNAKFAPDAPSAEPFFDLLAQSRDMMDPAHPRKGLWLSADNLRNLSPTAQVLLQTVHGNDTGQLPNFDGKGGVLVTQDRATARQAKADRDNGVDIQQILGALTGAGHGKPMGATHVVQQVTPDGAVTRESVTEVHEIPKALADFAHQGRQVRAMPLPAALADRLTRKAANG